MKPLLDIELDRQLYLPGEEINGRVILKFPGPKRIENLFLTLHGEEITGANNIIMSIVNPILKEELFLYSEKKEERPLVNTGTYPFRFNLPEDIPPSFASGNFSCLYYLSCKINWAPVKNMIIKRALTVVPAPISLPKPLEIEFGTLEEDIKLDIYLEKEFAFTGQLLRGNYNLEFNPKNPPKKLTIKLTAEAFSYGENISFKETIWETQKILPLVIKKEPHIRENFGINLPAYVPFTGIWNTFRVDWKIHAAAEFKNGKKIKSESHFDVYKFYEKFWTVIKKEKLAGINEQAP